MVAKSQIVGIDGKLKTELHHWWPRKLSALWADEEGQVTRLSWAGEELRAPPHNYGAITNAHHILLEGPWAGTVETIFSDADAAFPSLARSLSRLEHRSDTKGVRLSRVEAFEHPLALLAECLVSIIIRSPHYRNEIRRRTEAIWKRMGVPEGQWQWDENLVAGNIYRQYHLMVGAMESTASFVAIRTPVGQEFVFGEGCLSSLTGRVFEPQIRCLVPITPEVAVLAFSPSYFARDRLLLLSARDEEIAAVNEITQAYTKDYIFFRSKRPDVIPEFAQREFMRLEGHRHPWCESLIAESQSFSTPH